MGPQQLLREEANCQGFSVGRNLWEIWPALFCEALHIMGQKAIFVIVPNCFVVNFVQ